MKTKNLSSEPVTANGVNTVLAPVISDIEKEFMLEDYKVGQELEIFNGTFKVVSNDLKQITLEPIKCNLWYKYSVDFEAGKETYRQIKDGKIVDTVQ